MRKGDDGEKKKKGKKENQDIFVATNVVASRPPERRPTATPTARANMYCVFGSILLLYNRCYKEPLTSVKVITILLVRFCNLYNLLYIASWHDRLGKMGSLK